MVRVFFVLLLFVGVIYGQLGRNRHKKCTIVINEIYFGRPTFIEVAKLCNDNEVHDYKKLGGHVLLIVDATDTSILKTFWLHDKSLGPPELQSASGTRPINTAIMQPTVRAEELDVSGSSGQSVQRFQEINCNRNPHCTTVAPERKRRSPESIQTKARYFYVVEFEKTFPEEFLVAFLLLKLGDKDVKSKSNVLTTFTEGRVLSTDLLEKIKTNAVDAIILANTSSDYRQQLNQLLPGSLHDKTPVTAAESEVSYSKCDDTLLPMIQESFQVSTTSLFNPNICQNDAAIVDQDSDQSGDENIAKLPFIFRGMKLLRIAKQLAINVWFHIDTNDDPELLTKNPVEVAATLLGLGESTVYDIVRQFKAGKFFSNSNKRNRACPVTEIEDDEKIILYKIIISYYKRNEVPKLRRMREEFITKVTEHRKSQQSQTTETDPASVSECNSEYNCCARSFGVILKKNGYNYGQINAKDSAVHLPYVIHNRHKYLKRKAEVDAYRNLNLLFQDETWIDPNDRPKKGWILRPKLRTMKNRPDFTFGKHKSSRGGRIVVLGIGGESGYINCATEVYKVSKSKAAVDYHANVNGQKFIAWISKVLTCLPTGKKFVIIMDNCPFHNLKNAPDSRAKREVYLNWLKEKKSENKPGIPDNLDTLRKGQLWDIVKEVRSQIPAIIDDMVSKAGHEILRLPQYSPEMNPIEYAWKDLKHHVRDKNTKQDINDAVNLAKSFMDSYGGDKWKKHIGHCQKVEEMYREGDADYAAFIKKNPDMQRLQPWEESEGDEYEFEDPDDSIDQMPVFQDSSF